MPRPRIVINEEDRKRRQREATKRYISTDNGKSKRKDIMKSYYERNKERLKAQRRARYQIKKAEQQNQDPEKY